MGRIVIHDSVSCAVIIDSDADSHSMNVGSPQRQPGMTSDKNLPFTPPKSSGPPLLSQRGNVNSEDPSHFGSGAVDSDHLSGPPQVLSSCFVI